MHQGLQGLAIRS